MTAAIGDPQVPLLPRGDVPPRLNATATAVVDRLLARLSRLAALLDGNEPPADFDLIQMRLILEDLSLVAGLLRALNADAGAQLDRASAELQQARDSFLDR